jgi:hypothetical protein
MAANWKVGRRVGPVLMACACLPGVSAAQPAASTQQLQVTARVRENAQLRVLSQPAFFEVREEDIALGYVDVDTPLQIEVISNLAQGVQLSFSALDGAVRQARARNSSSAEAPRRVGMRRDLLQVHLRLELTASARPGRHAWPVQISMEAL